MNEMTTNWEYLDTALKRRVYAADENKIAALPPEGGVPASSQAEASGAV